MDFLSTIPLVRLLSNWIKSRIGLNREHDIALFKKLDGLADETCLDKIINNSIFISYFHSEEDDILRHLIDALKRTENQFLESVVRLRAQQFAWELGELLSFVRQTFDEVPSGRHLKFRPYPIDSAVYDAESKELIKRIEKAWEAYTTYRSAVKERLRV